MNQTDPRNIEVTEVQETGIACSNCLACCCRLEVMLITQTGVPSRFIETDEWGGETMARLDDGWCAALDRSTMLCTIYEQRPWVCQEFAVASFECGLEREKHLPSPARPSPNTTGTA